MATEKEADKVGADPLTPAEALAQGRIAPDVTPVHLGAAAGDIAKSLVAEAERINEPVPSHAAGGFPTADAVRAAERDKAEQKDDDKVEDEKPPVKAKAKAEKPPVAKDEAKAEKPPVAKDEEKHGGQGTGQAWRQVDVDRAGGFAGGGSDFSSEADHSGSAYRRK